MTRLAIITSHPIQYYAPWFTYLAQYTGLELKVFYLWDFGIEAREDHEFGHKVRWDIPLLEGYDYEFVPNVARRPGTSHLGGLNNPGLADAVRRFAPHAVLLMVYNYLSIYRFLAQWKRHEAPLLFRGDSHRLEPRRGWKEGLRGAIIRRVFARFSALLYVGRANREYFEMHGVPAAKLFHSPHAVNNDWFQKKAEDSKEAAAAFRASLGIEPSRKVVLFLGKLIPRKRPLDLLRAFLATHSPEAALVFAGSGSLEHALRAEAAGNRDIHFTGFLNQSEVPAALQACDLLVLPSEVETWGLVLNEAMCFGKALLASSLVGAAPDLIESGKNGLIFPARDVDALARALAESLRSRSQLRQWGARSLEMIQGYTYETATAGLLEAVRAVEAQHLAAR